MNLAPDLGVATLAGVVVHGDGRGRTLGFPTANLAVAEADLPPDGIYAAWAEVDDHDAWLMAVVSVGSNPTFAGRRPRRAEVHLLDREMHLYGSTLVVRCVQLLRETCDLGTRAALIAQSMRDVTAARGALSASSSALNAAAYLAGAEG